MGPLTDGERQEFQNRAVALSHMLRGEGWKLMQTSLEQNAQAAEQAMMGATDAFSAAKHMGALKALKDMLNWPAQELQLLSSALTNS
jgi:hypothetical protein